MALLKYFGQLKLTHSRQKIALAKPGKPQNLFHSFVAGLLGGYVVWGPFTSVNHQITLYFASRVAVGCAKLGYEKLLRFLNAGHFASARIVEKSDVRKGDVMDLADRMICRLAHPIFASVVWGVGLMVFEHRPDVLHKSLRASMVEIYRAGIDAEVGV